MAEVVVSRKANADLDRLVTFLVESQPAAASETTDHILRALGVLRDFPTIGRPVDGVMRELVISRGGSGYLALYEYDLRTDRVFVQALRHQREAGYLERGMTE